MRLTYISDENVMPLLNHSDCEEDNDSYDGNESDGDVIISSDAEYAEAYTWTSANRYIETSLSLANSSEDVYINTAFLESSEVDKIRSHLRDACEWALESTNECTVMFCLQRNPWRHSESLFEEVYLMLSHNADMVNELNGYFGALSPSEHRMAGEGSLRSADYEMPFKRSLSESSSSSEDSSGAASDGDWDSEDSTMNSASGSSSPAPDDILRANEVTIMRTFMTFAAISLQGTAGALSQDDAFKTALETCVESWWDYAKLFI